MNQDKPMIRRVLELITTVVVGAIVPETDFSCGNKRFWRGLGSRQASHVHRSPDPPASTPVTT